MGTTVIQTLTLPVLPTWPLTAKYTHQKPMGFLAVSGGFPTQASIDATGGFSRSERSRTNECVVRLQPITNANVGINVSAAQGSQKPVGAPMGALASGVPPRSRPV